MMHSKNHSINQYPCWHPPLVVVLASNRGRLRGLGVSSYVSSKVVVSAAMESELLQPDKVIEENAITPIPNATLKVLHDKK